MGLTVMQARGVRGLGLSATTSAMMMEEGARWRAPYGLVHITNMGAKIVMRVGSEEQKKYYAGLLAVRAMASFCLTRRAPAPTRPRCAHTAVKKATSTYQRGQDVHYNGGIANVYLVVATTDPGKAIRASRPLLWNGTVRRQRREEGR